MKPTQEQVTEWSNEAGLYASRQTDDKSDWKIIYAQQFATLAYEAGRKDENEACAQVVAYNRRMFATEDAARSLVDTIRARREQ